MWTPRSLPVLTNARKSLGKQLPPKPRPGYKNCMPMRSSEPTASRTCSTSPPAASHSSAISFMKEIFVAKSAFDAYLTISALFGLMRCRRLR